ncbi:MAG: hypothetical protein ABL930_03750 [Pseudobdellovibrio sp.]
MKITLKSILIWLGFLIMAFVNGAFRELVLINIFDIAPLYANQISCLTGVSLWTLLLLFFWKKLEIKKISAAAWIGISWLVATLLFETFIINHRLTWPQILHTYDVSAGEYWGLVLIWIGLMPVVFFTISTKPRPSSG